MKDLRGPLTTRDEWLLVLAAFSRAEELAPLNDDAQQVRAAIEFHIALFDREAAHA